jgi:hypothetical protein
MLGWGIFLAELLLVVSVSAKAAMILGPGITSCGTWAQERRDRAQSNSLMNEAWVLGYLSAYNTYGPKATGHVSKGTDANGLLAWIDNYCSANPLKEIFDATEALILELEKRTR